MQEFTAKSSSLFTLCPETPINYYICTWKNKEVKIFISANFC